MRTRRRLNWLARIRDPVRDGYTEIKIGPSDDANGRTVPGLSFDQAASRAREIFSEQEAKRISGVKPGGKKRPSTTFSISTSPHTKAAKADRKTNPAGTSKILTAFLPDTCVPRSDTYGWTN